MNIAIFTDSFLPHVSGVCSAVINQANELCRQGHQVMIFRPKAFGASGKKRLERSGELNAKIRDILISLPSNRQPGLHIALPMFAPTLPVLRKFRPDVLHVHTEWGCGWEGVMMAKMLRKPLVGTFHTFFAEPEYLKQFHIPNHRLTQNMMWRYSVFFYNHCDRVLSPSRSVIEQLTARGIDQIPHLMSNGIPATPLCSEDEISRKRAEMGLVGPTFAYIGRMSGEKCLPVLLQAFREVLGARPDAQLLMVGDGPAREELALLSRTLGIAPSTIFTGSIPHRQLMAENLPRVARIFVTPSTSENQPVSLLEAMSMGVPVVGADAKGIPELIRHEDTGLLFPPGDFHAMAAAMLRLLDENDLWQICHENCFALARDNHIENVVRQLTDHYQQTLEAQKPRRRMMHRRLRAMPRPPRA
ncbi:MAG: glycosyltransferase [Verrucomicrobia bacterium]|nr:glycosyltransferase [Verrucomicrobiota bacterium]MCH8512293.1 glycosyltransferase [Kiritimatiellia bacterium]